jgi:hypothetical protein
MGRNLIERLKTGFELVIGFTKNLQVVTTINFYAVATLHNLQSLHTNLFSLSALVFKELQRRSYKSLTESHIANVTHK